VPSASASCRCQSTIRTRTRPSAVLPPTSEAARSATAGCAPLPRCEAN
jgi:hypothetical protein